MSWGLPCDPSELTHFRKRIGTDGAERILASTIDLHGEKAKEKEVVVDTTVQEKNITFPTDTKLATTRCRLACGNKRPALVGNSRAYFESKAQGRGQNLLTASEGSGINS